MKLYITIIIRSCVKVEVAVLGSPSLAMVLMVSADVKQHSLNLNVNMVLNVHRTRPAYLGGGEGGGRRWREREIIYLSLHCHNQNDFCIKIGSDERHSNVSAGSDGQSHN